MESSRLLRVIIKIDVRQFSRDWVGRGYLVAVMGSTWLLRGLCGCYGVYTPLFFRTKKKSPHVASTWYIYVKVGQWHKDRLLAGLADFTRGGAIAPPPPPLPKMDRLHFYILFCTRMINTIRATKTYRASRALNPKRAGGGGGGIRPPPPRHFAR